MDPWPLQQISRELGVIPYSINAASTSAFSRNRLFWTNVALDPQEGESLQAKPDMVSFDLAEDETRFGILEQGWQWHARRPHSLPCVTGFQRRERPLARPV
eukprot:7356270-Karenia_brevis.AAC.1